LSAAVRVVDVAADAASRVPLRRFLPAAAAARLALLARFRDVLRLEDEPRDATDSASRVPLPRHMGPEREAPRLEHRELQLLVLVDELEAQRLRVEFPRAFMVRHVHCCRQEFSDATVRHVLPPEGRRASRSHNPFAGPRTVHGGPGFPLTTR